MTTPGQTIQNRYTVVAELARGGQATVYQAFDTHLNRVVALKEFRSDTLSPANKAAEKQLFETTAQMLARLKHQAIADIYDYFVIQNVPYVVCEWVNGDTLEARATRVAGGLSEQVVLKWGIQICDALRYLHSQSPPIIYRDLTPSNVMVAPAQLPDSSDHIKLIDFGIARHFKQGQRQDTRELGTPGYAPPEQWGRSQAQTGPYSDVYALGATLLRLVTGLAPDRMPNFDTGNPMVLLRANLMKPSVSPALADVLEKATQHTIAHRYQTAADFQRALEQCQSGLSPIVVAPQSPAPTHTPPAPVPAPAPASASASRQQRWIVLAVLMLVGLCVGGGALAWMGYERIVPANSTPAPVPAPTSAPALPSATLAAIQVTSLVDTPAPAVTTTPVTPVTPVTTRIPAPGVTPSPERVRFAAGATATTQTIVLRAGQPKQFVMEVKGGQRIQAAFSRDVTAGMRDPYDALMLPLVQSSRYLALIADASGDYTLTIEGEGKLEMTITIPPLTASAGAAPPAPPAPVVPAPVVPAPAPTAAQPGSGAAIITAPADGSRVSGIVNFYGTAMMPGFKYYKFEIEDPRCPLGKGEFLRDMHVCFLTSFETPVRNGLLMQWDTRTVSNGSYVLHLAVVDTNGNVLAQIPRVRLIVQN